MWRRLRGLGWLPLCLLGLALVLAGSAGVLSLASRSTSAGLPPGFPGGDVLAISQGSGQAVASTPLQDPPEPPDVATPTSPCGPGSHPLTGYADGRVPAAVIDSGAAKNGFWCNLQEVAHQGSSGGFKVWAYQDPEGHLCAYYDTALLYPLNAVTLDGKASPGVAVLDMSDPSHPVQTDTLTSLPMLSPHESLALNAKRGLLAAVLGNPSTYPGDVAIYSLAQDCRHPVLDFTGPIARFGHEGAFSPDGNTFWATSTSFASITAIDVSNPKQPHVEWQGQVTVHGLSISDNGDIAYFSEPSTGQLLTMDVSQIQNRVPNPQVKEISRLTWSNVTIPQSSFPMTINGHPYLLEFDEYAFRYSAGAPPNTVGAARIIDVADEAHPHIVSNLRLQVNQPAEHAAAADDPGALSPVQGYAAHYCGIPREVDPEIVACSFINSGLRIFNIQNPLHPREVGYYISPPKAADENGAQASDFAMSKPAFDPALREVWYTDGTTGFYVLKLDKSIWPDPTGVPAPRVCVSPSGRLLRTALGPLSLGEPRGAARSVFNKYSTRGRTNFDFYCLSGGGLRAGYPSRALLGSLPRGERARFRGRIVLELTSDRFYAFRGVEPGSSLAAARRKLHVGRGFTVGLNTWYLVRGAVANGVFKVRHGEVQEVGLAPRALTSTRAQAARFFHSFGS